MESGQGIEFLNEGSRDCSTKPSHWRREGRLLVDNNNNALAVQGLAGIGGVFLSCPMKGELVLADTATVKKETKSGWKECARSCSNDRKCKAWMWSIGSEECSTAEEDPTDIDTMLQGSVSGSNACSGNDLVLETAVQDKSNSAQHWTIHLSRISLYGTEFYLEKSPKLTPPTYLVSSGPSTVSTWNFDPLG